MTDGRKLSMPWAGGINSAQVNTMDLNADNKPDLVIFDKGVSKVWTYLQDQNAYRYAPEYESLFPPEVYAFMLLRDYNCDGKKDLFTFNSSVNGVSVYKNTTVDGENLSWQKLSFTISTGTTEILLTKGFSGFVNILPGIDDVPTITDMDNDGDLDIVNMRFVNPSTAEYHKNFSMERLGRCDTLVFERQTQRWGDWEECSCGVIAFGQTCDELTGRQDNDGARTEHNGGKALLALDMDNDGNKDILYSEEQCGNIYYMHNNGTSELASMNAERLFPTASPVSLFLFPAPYLEDVDFDGVPDFLASPNLNGRTLFNTNFNQSLWYYKNTGTAQLPNFTLVKRNFMQDQMIDIGDNSVPAFADADGDGDQDMFVGTFTSSSNFTGRIMLYENTGTATSPSFKLVTDDFAFLSFAQLYNIRPQFADVDADGTLDLVFTGTGLTTGTTSLYYMPNSSKEKIVVSGLDYKPMNFNLASTENVRLHDINSDGALDLLVGKNTGALLYYENNGPAGSFSFALKNSSYLNLATSTSRQNLSVAIGDLDADGYEDLITGDQRGILTVYNNFRSTDPLPQGTNELILNTFSESYTSKNLGGRVWPAVVNLFNTNKPAIVTGNTSGGLYVLKSDDSIELPPDPVVTLFPNPVERNGELSIYADRNMSIQIFSILGQKMTEPIFIPANQTYVFSVQHFAPGMYFARYSASKSRYAIKFMVR